MANKPIYTCSQCGPDIIYERHQLTVKKVQFLEMGTAGKTLRTRVKEWLCPRHVASDPDWRRPAYRTGAPPRDDSVRRLTPDSGGATMVTSGTELT